MSGGATAPTNAMTHLAKGDRIEVSRAAAFYPATVLRPSPANQSGLVHVRYSTLPSPTNPNKRLKEHVPATRVRPSPPTELHRYFKEGDAVDADHGGAWRAGRVVEILENSRYVVEIGAGEGERVELDQWSLRVHRDWDDGCWIPPLPDNQVKSSELTEEPKRLKLRIKFSGRPFEPKFYPGTIVEVKRDKEGRLGSWFNAVIVDSIGDEKFLVEYQSYRANTKTEILSEVVDASNIRPCPPEIARLDRYMLFQEVDVFHNGVWLMGHVFKVLGDDKYIVRVGSKNDVLIVEHSKVRNHQDWIDGKWVASTLSPNQEITRMETETDSYETQPKTTFKPRECSTISKRKSLKRILDAEFTAGTVVEVKSDEDGYHGSWYTAIIMGSIENDKYKIEYQTLKTEDESEPLKEKVDACHLRPCPPNIQRVDRFRLFERVDVWYNDGWWVGIITRILDGLDYTVFFWTTNEELECGHFALRPHQEWVNGKFIADFMKPPVQLPRKPRPGKSKRENGFTHAEANLYSMGMKVEVRSDEDGYSGTWYPAVILGHKGKGKFLVEYKTLKADDKMVLLKEVVNCYYIRPSPPVTQSADTFKLFEEVEVWYNIAWWHGCVCEVFKGSKYAVRIKSTDDVVEFEHSELRRYKDWVRGR